MAVLLQSEKTHDGARYGTRPHKDEQAPAPIASITHGDEGEWRVAARNVPVDGGMVPLAQHLLEVPVA